MSESNTQFDFPAFRITDTVPIPRRPPPSGLPFSLFDHSVDLTIKNSYNNDGDSEMDLLIDKFTPCLEKADTGMLLPTSFAKITKTELASLKGWNFNWQSNDLSDTEIFKLHILNDNDIQGLVAITDYPRDMAVYVNLAESAPFNLGKNKRYNGVGGHLFAIAAQISLQKGYGGFVFMDAKNMELVEHYHKTLGAQLLGRPHPYRMFIDEANAERLLQIYTLEEE